MCAGENISLWIVEDVLPRFGMTACDIVMGCPDNAANVLKALRLSKTPFRGCLGHGLQTAMQEALGTKKVKDPANSTNCEARDLIAKNKKMVTKVHFSTKNNKYLKISQKTRGVPEAKLKSTRQDVATRFNSTGLTVERNNELEHDLTAMHSEQMQNDCDKVICLSPPRTR